MSFWRFGAKSTDFEKKQDVDQVPLKSTTVAPKKVDPPVRPNTSKLLSHQAVVDMEALRAQMAQYVPEGKEEVEDNSAPANQGANNSTVVTSPSRLLNFLATGKGQKSAQGIASVLKPVIDSLTGQELSLLYRMYKKVSCTLNNYDQVMNDAIAKGQAQISNEAGQTYQEVEAARKQPLINFETNAKACKLVIEKLQARVERFGWDQIGMCIIDDCKAMREANKAWTPTFPASFYSKAYCIGSGVMEFMAEATVRMQAASLVVSFTNMAFFKSTGIDDKAELQETLPLGRIGGAKSYMLEYGDADFTFLGTEIGAKNFAHCLAGAYVMDVKFAWFTSDFKTSKVGNPGAHKDYKDQTLKYILLVFACLDDNVRGATYMAQFQAILKRHNTLDFKGTGDFGQLYYKALRQIRLILRKVKIAVLGRTIGNNRIAAEDMNIPYDAGKVDLTEIKAAYQALGGSAKGWKI